MFASLWLVLTFSCEKTSPSSKDARSGVSQTKKRPSSVWLERFPPRERGPLHRAKPTELANTSNEIKRLITVLSKTGVSKRELASMADIRGYRLYRRRRAEQALLWFEQAVALDRAFEPSIYNAARCSALLGRKKVARSYLRRLKALGTPLSRLALKSAPIDQELKTLFKSNASP